MPVLGQHLHGNKLPTAVPVTLQSGFEVLEVHGLFVVLQSNFLTYFTLSYLFGWKVLQCDFKLFLNEYFFDHSSIFLYIKYDKFELKTVGFVKRHVAFVTCYFWYFYPCHFEVWHPRYCTYNRLTVVFLLIITYHWVILVEWLLHLDVFVLIAMYVIHYGNTLLPLGVKPFWQCRFVITYY